MFFDPQTIKDESEKTEDDIKFLDDFFESAYESIKKTNNISETVVFESDTHKIKLAKEHITESLNLMLNHFIEKEEYEKSADIRDAIKKENEGTV
jgi:protein-arginine kinase activator protein McsA